MSRKWKVCVRGQSEVKRKGKKRREEEQAVGRVLTAILWPKPEPG